MSDESSTTTGEPLTTTIPLPEPTTVASTAGTAADTGSDGSTGAVDPTGPGEGSTSDASSTGAASGSSTTDSPTSSSSTGEPEPFVEWCILQFPASIATAPATVTTVYARLYVEGITDATVFVDEDALVVAQFGYGEDGSMPDDAWSWVDGIPNAGWDGSMAKGGFGNENNDEYQGDLSFDAVGTYDYAARFSADGGTTWVYCDLDDLQTGGYTPEQAGDAVIG